MWFRMNYLKQITFMELLDECAMMEPAASICSTWT